jgi:hypothetical protein
MKKQFMIFCFALTFVLTSVKSAEAGWLFGKHQYHEGAWSDGNCAYIRHYYKHRFFGFDVAEGFKKSLFTTKVFDKVKGVYRIEELK